MIGLNISRSNLPYETKPWTLEEAKGWQTLLEKGGNRETPEEERNHDLLSKERGRIWRLARDENTGTNSSISASWRGLQKRKFQF